MLYSLIVLMCVGIIFQGIRGPVGLPGPPGLKGEQVLRIKLNQSCNLSVVGRNLRFTLSEYKTVGMMW